MPNTIPASPRPSGRAGAPPATFAALLLAAGFAAPASAEDKPSSWASSITLNAQIEGGFTLNPNAPKTNFGQLFTDKPNTVLMNQLLLTAQRPIDPKSPDWDIGFKFQTLYGSDGRYTQYMGVFNHLSTGRYQLDIVEANIAVHAPVLTPGGIDFKLGMYATPIGYETIDPATNPFYSHSYIFNFGLPLKHTGALAVVHATDMIDVYLGIDTGVNTTFGKGGDNNGAIAGIGGFQLTLLDGKLTALALTHIGPENPSRVVPNADRYMRYLSDMYITYKPNDTWSFVSDFNWIRDDFAKADGYGFAQYVSYAWSPTITLNARAELFADSKNFFVASFPGPRDFINAELGFPATVVSAPSGTTYGAITLGFTYKPELPIKGLMIRPEIRYDRSMSGTRPFNGGKDMGSFTFASDIVVTF